MAKTAKAQQGWRSKYPASAKIKRLTQDNPHSTGTKDRRKWQKLGRSGTVRSAVKKGVDLGYIRYAEQRGLIEIRP